VKTGFSFVLVAVFALSCVGTTACSGFGSSKVEHGQRYSSGDGRYDGYFENVHQQQAGATHWEDDKKASRRTLVSSLALKSDASDGTLTSATRQRVSKMGGAGARLELGGPRVVRGSGTGADNGLFNAVEETARTELDRARRLRAASERYEELAKQGENLKKDADREFENRGAAKADEKKSDKQREIRRELSGAISSMKSLASDARDRAEDIDDFLEDLGHALEGKDSSRPKTAKKRTHQAPPPPAAKAEETKEGRDSKESKDSPKSTKKPAGKSDKADAKPEGSSAPPKAQDEVFNP
jgi:hypothetical protein